MATFQLWLQDALAEFQNGGSQTVTGVNDSGGTATAGLATDIEQTTEWAPGAGATKDFQMNLGSAKAISAIFFGAHNLNGLTVTLYSGATFGSVTTSRKAHTFTSNDDFLLNGFTGDSGSGVSAQFWVLRITSPVAGTRVGTIAMFTTAGKIDMTATYGPTYPIEWSLRAGVVYVLVAGGGSIAQVYSGTQRAISFNVHGASVADGELWDSVEDLFVSTSGFSTGLVLTDDNFDTANGRGKGYYARPLDATLHTMIALAGARVDGTINLVTLGKKVGS